MSKRKLVLYPKVEYFSKSFRWSKKITVPSQSMSLQEILRRFTRKESLPIEKDGVYETRFGDLEKLRNEDLVVQHERINEIRDAVDSHNKREKAKKEKEEKEKEDKLRAASQPAPPTPSPDKPTT